MKTEDAPPWPACAAKWTLIAAVVMPLCLALFVPWKGRSVEFVFLAATHLLGLALVTLCLASLMRVLDAVGYRGPFRPRLVVGICGACILGLSGLRWSRQIEGVGGQPALVLSQALTIGVMLLVVGYLFELIRAFRARLESLEEPGKPSEATS